MPVQGPIHVDRPLTNISIGYRSMGNIADELFPVVPVMKESDLYYIFDKANSLRSPRTLRANGAEANEDNLSLSTASYRLQEHALKELITKRDRDNADAALNLEVSTVEDLSDKLLREREIAAAAIFSDGAWANESSIAATAHWGLQTTVSNPILVADSAAAAVNINCGRLPNTCVLNDRAFRAVKEHLQVVDRVKYTSSESVSESLIARLFGVDKLLVARSSYNTAAEGLAATMANTWTDLAWFGYVSRSPGLKDPSALYCFKKDGGAMVKRWTDDARNGEWFETSHMYAQVTPATDAGYLVVNPVQ